MKITLSEEEREFLHRMCQRALLLLIRVDPTVDDHKKVVQLIKKLEKKVEQNPLPQTCTFCNNPESFLSVNTCCTGCSKLPVSNHEESLKKPDPNE